MYKKSVVWVTITWLVFSLGILLINQAVAEDKDESRIILRIPANDTLTLKSGNYYFNEIKLGKDAKLITQGTVRFFITGPADFSQGEVINQTEDASQFVIISSGQDKDVIYLPETGTFCGAIYAPEATVIAKGKGLKIIGAIVGNNIKIEGEVDFQYDPRVENVTFSLPREIVNEKEEVPGCAWAVDDGKEFVVPEPEEEITFLFTSVQRSNTCAAKGEVIAYQTWTHQLIDPPPEHPFGIPKTTPVKVPSKEIKETRAGVPLHVGVGCFPKEEIKAKKTKIEELLKKRKEKVKEVEKAWDKIIELEKKIVEEEQNAWGKVEQAMKAKGLSEKKLEEKKDKFRKDAKDKIERFKKQIKGKQDDLKEPFDKIKDYDKKLQQAIKPDPPYAYAFNTTMIVRLGQVFPRAGFAPSSGEVTLKGFFDGKAEKADFGDGVKAEITGNPDKFTATAEVTIAKNATPTWRAVMVTVADAKPEKDSLFAVCKLDLKFKVNGQERDTAYICLNDDDDNDNDKPDLEDTDVPGENDLVELVIKPVKPNNLKGVVKLKATKGGDKVKIWKDKEKKEEISEVLVSELPKSVWIEGVKVSDKKEDIELTLEYPEFNPTCGTLGDKNSKTVKATVIEVETIGPAQTIDGLDSDAFTVVITPSDVTVTSYQWIWSAPAGAGNNPHVDFDKPTEKTTIVKRAWWFAFPDNRLASVTGFDCQYTINCKVIIEDQTFSDISPPTWTVYLPHYRDANRIASTPDFPPGFTHRPYITGMPTIAVREVEGQKQWYVSGMGDLRRTAPRIETQIPQTSQFYNKIVTVHEGRHVEQWTSMDPWQHLFDATALYNNKIQFMTSTKSANDLMLDIAIEIDTQNFDDEKRARKTSLDRERDAHQQSNAVKPHYLEFAIQ